MRILVVDDSRAMRAIIVRGLRDVPAATGADIVEASDGREAFDLVCAGSFDLVLSDWNMPNMTGIELLRALNDAGVTPAFGFVTSSATSEMQELAATHGAAFVATKPLSPSMLGELLDGAPAGSARADDGHVTPDA